VPVHDDDSKSSVFLVNPFLFKWNRTHTDLDVEISGKTGHCVQKSPGGRTQVLKIDYYLNPFFLEAWICVIEYNDHILQHLNPCLDQAAVIVLNEKQDTKS
jgi:hypothetical protein